MLASICLHKQISLQSDKEDLNSKIDSADLLYSGKEFQSSGACSMRKITLYNFHSSWCISLEWKAVNIGRIEVYV